MVEILSSKKLKQLLKKSNVKGCLIFYIFKIGNNKPIESPSIYTSLMNSFRKGDVNGVVFLRSLLSYKKLLKVLIKSLNKYKDYYATINCDKENYTKLYKGICKTTFKKRYANHKKSFNIPTYKNDIKLSTEYRALKTKQLNPKVSWQIKKRYNSYNPISRRCNLYLNEKLEILDDQDKNLLNKLSEIISHCHHQNKFKLKTLASNTADKDIT